MDLKDFISKTISDVVTGLKESSGLTSKKIDLASIGSTNRRHIEFDVAVAAEKVDQNKGGGKIEVFSIAEIGLERGSETKNSTVSRIKFGVRVK